LHVHTRFKSSPDDVPAIAGQLGVANILEGSVQRTGDQVRVNVQLIKGVTDTHLWAETFDRHLTDIFAVESEIAKTMPKLYAQNCPARNRMPSPQSQLKIQRLTNCTCADDFFGTSEPDRT
jgi:hypothetical protein